jgi:hypothetical protein
MKTNVFLSACLVAVVVGLLTVWVINLAYIGEVPLVKFLPWGQANKEVLISLSSAFLACVSGSLVYHMEKKSQG